MSKLSIYLAVGALAALVAGATVAHANSDRVTKGDAIAVFEAFPNGGSASAETGSAPSDGLVDGKTVIRPFVFFNGKHYCELDWHVALIAYFEDGPRQAATDALAARFSLFWIDGAPTPTERTAPKRSLRDDTEVYWVAEGVLLSPSDLSVDTHTLRVKTFGPMPFDRTITFHVDAAGSGACL